MKFKALDFVAKLNHQMWHEVHKKFAVDYLPRTDGIQPEATRRVVSALEPVRDLLRSITRDV